MIQGKSKNYQIYLKNKSSMSATKLDKTYGELLKLTSAMMACGK